MAEIYGIQVQDENGNITLDVTDRLTKYLGKLTIRAEKNVAAIKIINLPDSVNNFNFWLGVTAFRTGLDGETGVFSYTLYAGYVELKIEKGDFSSYNNWVEYDVIYGVY